MKKVLCFVLTLAMLISCISVFTINVSAHQNLSEAITFDEIDENNVTGYKFGTGNFAKEEGADSKNIEKYTPNGKFSNFHHSATSYADVAKAPDDRYGMSLGVCHTFGTSNPYVQVNYTPNIKYYGTIHTTVSLYVTEASQYIQRAYLLRSSENSGYRKYPVMFDYGTNRRILFFDTDTGFKYSPNKWYDFDITYNIDSMEYHIICYEDGKLYIDKMGIDGGQKYSYCDLAVLYHGPTKDGYGEQYGYWDNFLLESANRFEIPKTSSSKEVWDFEDFEKQEFSGGLGMPSSPRGTWGLGYQGSTNLEIVKAVTDEKTDDMEVAPNLGKSIAFGNFEKYDENTAVDGKNDYSYPQFRYNFNSGTWPSKFQIAFSTRLIQNGALNLYMKGSNQCNAFCADGTRLYIFGERKSEFDFNTTDWYDVNIIFDAAIGFYSVDIKNRTSPSNPPYHIEGYEPSIITSWARTDRIIYLQEGTGANEKYVYLDNIYFGELMENEIPNVEIADTTAAASAEAEGTATCYLPFASAFAGHQIGARLTIEGSAPTVFLGDTAIDVSTFEPGTYPLVVKMMNNNPPEFTVMLDGAEVPFESSAIPTAITLTAPAGEGNKASLSNISYQSFNLLSVTGDKVFTDVKVDDDVTVEFSNDIAEIVSVNVYEPYGELSDEYAIESSAVILPENNKIAISFDKEKEKHYHITYTVKDVYGAILSDFVEADTEFELYHTDGIKFYDSFGSEVTVLPKGTVDVMVDVFSGDGIARDGFVWAGLYDADGNLYEARITPVEFKAEVTPAYLSFFVPDNGKAYRLKAGVMAGNLAPVDYREIANRVIIFRLDDIKTSTYDEYQALVDWAADEKIPLSLGMVCNSIDEGNNDYIEAVKDMVKTGYAEIWCHGYDHTYHEGTGVTAEFTNQTAEYQAEILKKCYDHVYEKTNGIVEIHSFATPSGGYDENTHKALEMLPEYTTFMGNTTIPYDGDGFMNLTTCLWMESSTGVLQPLETLKGYYENRVTGEYMIFAGHGGYWDETSVQTFKDFASYLKDNGVAFMTPTQYYNFVK